MKKNLKQAVLLIPLCVLALTLSTTNADAKTISVTGKGIQQAVNSAVKGDIVLVQPGTYREKVEFVNKSGITLKANGAVVLDGSGLSTPNDDCQLILIEDSNDITIQGFEICNYKTASAKSFPKGIMVTGSGSNITLKDNKIHHIENTSKDGGANGIGIYGTNSGKSINNLVIDNNEVRDCKLALSESVCLNGNVENFKVTNNRVHDNNNIGIVFIGFEKTASGNVDRARNGECSNNTVYSITSRNNPSYHGDLSADGIYVDGGTQVTIKNNKVDNCDIGIELASEHKGKDTSQCTAIGNTISNCINGVSLGGYDSNRGKTVNCTIQNNTIQGSKEATVLLQYYCLNNNITNNTLIGKPYFTYTAKSTCSGNVTSPNTQK